MQGQITPQRVPNPIPESTSTTLPTPCRPNEVRRSSPLLCRCSSQSPRRLFTLHKRGKPANKKQGGLTAIYQRQRKPAARSLYHSCIFTFFGFQFQFEGRRVEFHCKHVTLDFRPHVSVSLTLEGKTGLHSKQTAARVMFLFFIFNSLFICTLSVNPSQTDKRIFSSGSNTEHAQSRLHDCFQTQVCSGDDSKCIVLYFRGSHGAVCSPRHHVLQRTGEI